MNVEDRWASLDMIYRRWPDQTGKNIQAGIKQGLFRMGRMLTKPNMAWICSSPGRDSPACAALILNPVPS